MTIDRVVFRNWKVETAQADAQEDDGSAPRAGEPPAGLDQPLEPPDPMAQARTERIARAVRHAIALLDDDEQELIIRYHFQGIGLPEMSELTGRPVHKLAALHLRALRRLRTSLHVLAHREFRKVRTSVRPCPICDSTARAQIDTLIAARDPRATWRPVMCAVAEQYGLIIRSPQVLIGHEKYHHGELS